MTGFKTPESLPKIFKCHSHIMFSKIKSKLLLKLYQYFQYILNTGLELERNKSFCENTIMHPTVKILQNAQVINFPQQRELISIGKDSAIAGKLLVFAHAGKIDIGESCYIGEGTRIWSAASIKIGNRVFISHNVNIHDTNTHSLNPRIRYEHVARILSIGDPSTDEFDIQSKPVCIEDDVWIGFNSTVLKGVRIGTGSIVAACSVVTKDVPEFVITAGNPAKVVKNIEC